MPRPFIFPDPNDRSRNEPSVIVSSAQVLGLYNQNNKNKKYERVTEQVKKWFSEEALKNEWDKADFHGSQCLLIKEFDK